MDTTVGTTASRRTGALSAMRWGAINALQALFLAVYSMFWMTMAIIACLVTRRGDTALGWGRRYWSTGLLRAAGARLNVTGLNHVRWDKPHVFVVNHQSMIDIAVLFAALPVNLHFIAKKSLFSVPFLGWYMRVGGMIPIDRQHGAASIETLRQNADRVAGGHSVLAFAEGTRSRDGVVAPFKKGAFMLAIQAQVAVVPISIEGARAVLPCDGFAVRPGVIRVAIGKPIATTVVTRDALMDKVHGAVVAMHLAQGGRVP